MVAITTVPKTKAEVRQCLGSKDWRKNNLYTIIDEGGREVVYRQKPTQRDFAAHRHPLDIVLKARQLGKSTEIDLDILDDALTIPNLTCGIIAQTKVDAAQLFETKIRSVYEKLPGFVKKRSPAIKNAGGHLQLANGSSIRVGVSFRSDTIHRLHISELGKICAKYPTRAEEIKTGTLPAVHPQEGGTAVIESTAEGGAGLFYDTCLGAQAATAQAVAEKRALSVLQWNFHFYPWFLDRKNQVDPLGIKVSDKLIEYFEMLREHKGIALSIRQRAWYAVKRDGPGGLGSLMKREHPSFVEEAFEQSVEGAVYREEMEAARSEGRIGFYPWEKRAKVYTAWDLGYHDSTVVVFFQVIKGEVRIIDCYAQVGRGAAHHAREVLRKDYIYGPDSHWAPHDIMAHEKSSGLVLKDHYEQAGIKFGVVERPRLKVHGINEVRANFNKFRFHADKTAKPQGDDQRSLVAALAFYRYEWDDALVCFKKDPLHDWASHYADAVQTLALAFSYHIVSGGQIVGYPGAIARVGDVEKPMDLLRI